MHREFSALRSRHWAGHCRLVHGGNSLPDHSPSPKPSGLGDQAFINITTIYLGEAMPRGTDRKDLKPKRLSLEVGDEVWYEIDSPSDPVKRTGKILLMDGSWCVVEHTSNEIVWVSLRCV